MSNRKRPVYVVVIPTGHLFEQKEAKLIVGIRQSAAGAETLKNQHKGAIVEKQFLVTE